MRNFFLLFFHEIKAATLKSVGWMLLISFAIVYFLFSTGNFGSNEISETLLGLGHPGPMSLFVAIGLLGAVGQFASPHRSVVSRSGKWMRSFGFDGLHLILAVLIVFGVANWMRGHEVLDVLPLFVLIAISLIVLDALLEVISALAHFWPVRLLVAFAAGGAAYIVT